MDLYGPVGPNGGVPIQSDYRNPDGTIRVLKEKCHTCPYRPDSSFKSQLKRIHEATKTTGNFNFCHNTYPSDVPDAMCKGSYDAFTSRFIGTPDFIEEPKSYYIVLPRDG